MSAPSEDDGTSPSVILSEPFQEGQTMLILVGLVASGKSTFAKALENYFPGFRRCNQDDLGNRQLVEELAYHTLREGRSPCIDRTNFNPIQRSYWTTIAREFPATTISIIVFDTPYHVCVSRLQRRTSHPTIKDARHGVTVLQKFASEFQMPSPSEGYDHILYLRPEDHPRPEYTRADILSILERLKASTLHSRNGVPAQHSIQSYFVHDSRGYLRPPRGYRGSNRGFSPTRGTLYGSPRYTTRAGGSHSPNWRRPDPGLLTNREMTDQRPTGMVNVPPMESSKGRGTPQ